MHCATDRYCASRQPIPKASLSGRPADWHKLLGVAPNGLLLGLVADGALGRPATLSPSGELTLFPRPDSDDERRRIALLQQESRRFEDGYELRVDRSGRSFDVYLRKPDGARMNVSELRRRAVRSTLAFA